MLNKNKLLISIFLVLAFTNVYSESKKIPGQNETALATFAGGCFWCMEPPFDKLAGVLRTTSGYLGGHLKNPSYPDVASGTSGHIEAVEIEFNPEIISFAKLLEVYWKNVDPTRSDGQFCDKGEQYRPVIFYHSIDQKTQAINSKIEIVENKNFPEKIKVGIKKTSKFYAAEEYHQNYYTKNPVRYRYYRYSCGRDKRLKELWGNKKG